jgi:hypothetical protein
MVGKRDMVAKYSSTSRLGLENNNAVTQSKLRQHRLYAL